MTNERKLELTLCGMLPYGLKGTTIYPNSSNESASLEYEDGLNGKCDIGSWLFGTYKTLPHLHSLSKLTEPILEGGLIPIEEFWKANEVGFFGAGHLDQIKQSLLHGYIDAVPFVIVEWLKKHHFNIYDLPSNMYIEKSEVK